MSDFLNAYESGDFEWGYAGGRVDRIPSFDAEEKKAERNGEPVGIVMGHIAAFSIDEGGSFLPPDKFHPGCFGKSIEEHKNRNMRQIRLKDHHWDTVGGFPIETVTEDNVGLIGTGEINLKDNRGVALYSMARQGVLVDFSIGFKAVVSEMIQGIRHIFEAIIWEGSIVDEPMNRDANIISVKALRGINVNPFIDLPVAPNDHVWDAKAAAERIDALPHSQAKNAYLCGDIMFGDIVNGGICVIPQALDSIYEQHKNNLPQGAVELFERYCSKMGKTSPFSVHEFIGVDEVNDWDMKTALDALNHTRKFSKGAAKILAQKFDESENEDDESDDSKEIKSAASSLVNDMASFTNSLR